MAVPLTSNEQVTPSLVSLSISCRMAWASPNSSKAGGRRPASTCRNSLRLVRRVSSTAVRSLRSSSCLSWSSNARQTCAWYEAPTNHWATLSCRSDAILRLSSSWASTTFVSNCCVFTRFRVRSSIFCSKLEYESRSRKAIRLNSSASSSSSSPVSTVILWLSSPAPIRAALACRARIGVTILRARYKLAATDKPIPTSNRKPVRQIEEYT